MKIYTRKGDRGRTSLLGGGRVAKDHPRVEAYGTVDELNSVVGWALTSTVDRRVGERLRQIQHDLFAIGAHLSVPPLEEGRRRPATPELPVGRVVEMEGWIDEIDGEVPPLRHFILPGGAPGAAALHVARTVCRRAERAVVRLAPVAGGEAGDRDESPGMELVVRYLNRLSDLLFAMARLENLRSDAGDVIWKKNPGDGEGESG